MRLGRSSFFVPATLIALLLPAAPTAAVAQSRGRENVTSVQVLVRDLQTRQEIARISPGGTINLPEGARVRINLLALTPGRGRGPLYPATEFTDPTRTGVRITRSSEENGAADLEVLPMRNPNRVQTIQYRVTETWVPLDLRTGSFNIRVGGDQAADAIPGERARELTRMLYQGILLREPDASGARSTAEAIQRGGYDGLLRAAANIANSDESHIQVYQRSCNEQRLLALYRQFLGVEANQVDRRQWDTDLQRLRNGELNRLVEELLRSDRFRSRYNFTRR
ncbi:MAG: hypothetical protein ACJ75H_10240 [Thermoanaerobaculia bacterium]